MAGFLSLALLAAGWLDAPAASQPAHPVAASRPASRPAADTAAELSDWLVHLARHYGHLRGATDPRRAALHALALTQAAADINPANAAAWIWSYDLLSRMGRDAEALAALGRYVRLEPADECAALQCVDLSLAALQTSEARGAWLIETLKQPGLPRSVESDLHRRLAEYFRERADTVEAGRQVEQALRLSPMNLAAREVAYDMFGETEPLLQRVELALQLIRINPSQVNVLWELGALLDGYAMHTQAQEWCLRAIETHRRSSNKPVPGDFWLDLAGSYAASRDDVKCLDAIRNALDARRDDARPKLLRAYVLRRAAERDPRQRADRLNQAQADIDRVASEYAARFDAVIRTKNASAAAEMAWFFAYVQPDRDKALKLAEIAMSAPYADTLARRASGFALLLKPDAAAAAKQLKPLAEADQMAGLGLAKSLIALGDRPAALEALHRAANLRYSGVAFEQVCKLLSDLGETPPLPPTYPRVLEALERFDRRALGFHQTPSDTLRLTLNFVDDPLPPDGPCRLHVRLENTNPPDSFSVTLGEGLMVRPRVVLSAVVGGRDGRRYPFYTEVLLNERPVLAPGASIEKTIAVDVGPLREDLLASATTAQTLEITAILDPIRGEGGYVAGLGSVHSSAARSTMPAMSLEPAALAELVTRTESPGAHVRIDAARRLGVLLACRERAMQAKPVAETLAKAGVEEALLKLCHDPDWTVRAFALDAAGWGRIGSQTLATKLADLVYDEQPAVRLLAVRLLARSQPKSFQKVLASLAASDAAPAVRLMARSFIPAPATSAPLSNTAARPEPDLP